MRCAPIVFRETPLNLESSGTVPTSLIKFRFGRYRLWRYASPTEQTPMRKPGLAAWLLCCLPLFGFAEQDTVQPATSPDDHVAVSKVLYQRMNWSVEVHTSGGLTGLGIGGFTLSSEGRLTCDSK